MMPKQQLMSQDALSHLSPVWFRYTDFIVERGEAAGFTPRTALPTWISPAASA